MAQDFYTLEEAAQRLGMTTAELNGMAQRREIRAFADRGTWRFRSNDVEELARRRGMPSEGEMPALKGAGNPAPTMPTVPMPGVDDPSSEIILAEEVPSHGPSDSDVILVAKGSDLELQPTDDEKTSQSFIFGTNKPLSASPKTPPPPPVELGTGADEDDSLVPIGREPMQPGSGDSQIRLDSLSGRLPDSGVRLVDFDLPPMSGVMPPPSSRKLPKVGAQPPSSKKTPKPPSDTTPRPVPPVDHGTPHPDEEVDLHEALARAEGDLSLSADQLVDKGGSAVDLGQRSGTKALSPLPGGEEGSSEFDLTPHQAGPSDSVFEVSNPSLESLELELSSSLETPHVGGTEHARPKTEDASETFELHMEGSDELDMATLAARPSGPPDNSPPSLSSEFDLSLQPGEESSSDFELTLEDDSSHLSPLEEGAGARTEQIGGEDVSSDFELALDDEGSSVTEDTGSEVVVIEEDDEAVEDDEGVVGAPITGRGVALDEDELEVEEAVDEAAVEEEEALAAAAAGVSADWGWWSLVHVPTALVMVFTGLLLFEMLRSVWSYNQPNMVTGPIYKMVESITK
jgi:excisionase family DNA binding protein